MFPSSALSVAATTLPEEDMESAEHKAAETIEQAENTPQVHGQSQGVRQPSRDKATDAGQTTPDAAQGAKDEVISGKNNTPNSLHLAGQKVKETLHHAKDSVTGNQNQ